MSQMIETRKTFYLSYGPLGSLIVGYDKAGEQTWEESKEEGYASQEDKIESLAGGRCHCSLPIRERLGTYGIH